MARTQLTKAQLLSELEAARIEIQRLSAENESLRGSATKSAPSKATTVFVKEHNSFAAACAAARELARSTGKSVRIS